jgi:hypothetical protein
MEITPAVQEKIDSLRRDLDRLEATIKEGKIDAENRFVSFVRYHPVEIIVFGMVGVILLFFLNKLTELF